jgi:nucleoside 2-deoxyribosyltransferase
MAYSCKKEYASFLIFSMKKKAYIAVGFKERAFLDLEIATIKDVLNHHDYDSIVFVDDFSFNPPDEREMMRVACREISSAEMLVAELSSKVIGVGIEVGYAKALGKKIVYLRGKGTEYSKTIGGLADDSIEYDNVDDLKEKLSSVVVSSK